MGNEHADDAVRPVEDTQHNDEPPVDPLIVGEVDEVVCPPGRAAESERAWQVGARRARSGG